MMFFFLVSGILTLAYTLLFFYYLFGWLTLREYVQSNPSCRTRVSIIIPVRNEESTMALLLNDLLSQTYPAELMEIVVVDDFSTDATASIVSSVSDSRIRFIQLAELMKESAEIFSYKKKAIETGIAYSQGELLITTDADCRMSAGWLQTMVNFYEQEKPKMIVAPVLIDRDEGVFRSFQSLDLIGMMGVTAATLHLNFPTMCSGANLAFTREAFEKVNGYEAIDQKTSGDDLLLMHKMAAAWPGGVKFIKCLQATVKTAPAKNFNSFFSQRMRWTSKSRAYRDWKIKANLLLVYVFNLSLLISLGYSLVTGAGWLIFIFQWAAKCILDFVFLLQVSRFFRRQYLLRLFLLHEVLHVFYIVSVGMAGNFFQTRWKGRRVQ